MDAAVGKDSRPEKLELENFGFDIGSTGLVLGFSHRCNPSSLVGIVPPAVPINLMEV